MAPRSAEAVLTIKPHGELTADTAVQFRDQTLAAMEGRSSVDADLSRITAMDCTGLGALIAIRNQACARQGRMRLFRPSPIVRRLFTVLSAAHFFEIERVIPQTAPPPVGELMVERLPDIMIVVPASSVANEPGVTRRRNPGNNQPPHNSLPAFLPLFMPPRIGTTRHTVNT